MNWKTNESYFTLLHGKSGSGKSQLCENVILSILNYNDFLEDGNKFRIIVFSSCGTYDNLINTADNKYLTIISNDSHSTVTASDTNQAKISAAFADVQYDSPCIVIVDSVLLDQSAEQDLMEMQRLIHSYRSSHIFGIFVANHGSDISGLSYTRKLFDFSFEADTEGLKFLRLVTSYVHQKPDFSVAVTFPCKIGTTIYEIAKGIPITSYHVTGYVIGKTESDDEDDKNRSEWYVCYETFGIACECPVSEFGKTLFLSRKDAERQNSALSNTENN